MTCPNRSRCTVSLALCAGFELDGWEAYCERDGATCARLKLSAAGVEVPDDLLPDGGILVTVADLEEWGESFRMEAP